MNMPANNPLPLRDIHLPDAVSAWPPAPGWWLLPLLLVLLALLAYAIIQYRKRRPSRPVNKIALQQFAQLKAEYQQAAPIELLRAVSQLLRRIALSYLPRETVASLTGKQWVNTLNQLSGESVFNSEHTELLATAAYRAEASFDTQALLGSCEKWIQSLPPKPAGKLL